jgi:hypothetical protein
MSIGTLPKEDNASHPQGPGCEAAPLIADELLTFADVGRLLPRRRGGTKVAISTIWRWTRRGSRGVLLPFVRVGGNVYISRSDLAEFIARLSSVDRAPQQPSPTTRSERAMKKLGQMGM